MGSNSDQDVPTAWRCIVEWIAQHAPDNLIHIRPPAAEETLSAIGHTLGRPLPVDLVAFWRQADGVTNEVNLFPPFHQPCSTELSMRRREMLLRHWNGVQEEQDPDAFAAYLRTAEMEPAGTPAYVWLPSWLPIGDATDSYLFVDCREGVNCGCIKRFFTEEGPEREVLWRNLAHLLNDVSGAMGKNLSVAGRRISVSEDGFIDWR